MRYSLKKHIALLSVIIFCTGAASGCTSAASSSVLVSSAEKNEVQTAENTTENNGIITAANGDTVTTKNYKCTMTKAYTAESLTTSYGYEQKPGEGKLYLILELEAENISSSKCTMSYLYFKPAADGYSADPEFLMEAPNGMDLFSGDILPGKKLAGYIAYKVNADWKEFELPYYEGFSSNPSFTFTLTPDRVTKK